jgi:C4-dicarboxylate-specific signal transduction histidine kinase
VGESDEALLRESSFWFFGAMCASLSHELNNVFATVNELSGLLDDLATAGRGGRMPDTARLESIARRIATQVQRGQRLSRQLNRFGHSVDPGWTEVDAQEILHEMVAVCGRRARLRKVELEAAEGSPLLVGTDPFQLRHLMWRCVEAALSGARPGDTLQLGTDGDQSSFRIHVSGRGRAEPSAELEERTALLEAVAGALGSRLQRSPEFGPTERWTVMLPTHAPADESSQTLLDGRKPSRGE